MRVSDIRIAQSNDYCELLGSIDSKALDKPFQLWYRFPEQCAPYIGADNGDPFLAALLLPAMRTGEPLRIDAGVSPKLAHSIAQIQAIYRCWDPTLSEVTIHAPVLVHQVNHWSPNVGLFFSLGVDSFYSLLKNRTANHSAQEQDSARITHLITIHGFDIYYGKWNTALFPRVLGNSTKVAEKFGAEILQTATNLRDLSDRFADWGTLYNGAALASVALALNAMFGVIYIAASHSYAQLFPWGSHPILDPLWSSDSTAIVHDGCDAGRLEKIRFIAKFPIVLETLRVCFTNPQNQYNCGRCEKCVRTMIGLHIAGALQNCKTLPHHLDVDAIRSLPVQARYYYLGFVEELITSLSDSGTDRDIRRALEESLSSSLFVSTKREFAALTKTRRRSST
jgi:hypothetical protein